MKDRHASEEFRQLRRLLSSRVMPAECLRAPCEARPDRWPSVFQRDLQAAVVYPVCQNHLAAVWDFIGCDRVQDCGPDVHALSTSLRGSDVVTGLLVHLADGGRVAIPDRDDWDRMWVLP